MSTTTRRYATYAEAEADGWRRINHSTDRDVSGLNMRGYVYQAPDGTLSETITLTEERNKLGRPGAFAAMIRV